MAGRGPALEWPQGSHSWQRRPRVSDGKGQEAQPPVIDLSGISAKLAYFW